MSEKAGTWYNLCMIRRTLFVIITVTLCLCALSCSMEKHVHQWNEGDVILEPTCQTEGKAIYTCMSCGETSVEPLPVIGHIVGDRTTVSPTCLEPGYVREICAMCNEVMNEVRLSPMGHDMWFAEHISDPDCEHEGDDLYSCSRCNEREIRHTLALGHNFTGRVEIIEPTEDSDGMKFTHCRRCNLALCVVIPRLD